MNDDQAEHSDVYDPAHEIEFEDEEPGIYNGDAYPGRQDAYDPNAAWHERTQLTDAIEVIEARRTQSR